MKLTASQAALVHKLETALDAHDAFVARSRAVYLQAQADEILDLEFQNIAAATAQRAGLTTEELATGSGKTIIAAKASLYTLDPKNGYRGKVLYVCTNSAAIGDLTQGIINIFHRVFKKTSFRLGALNDLSLAFDVCFVTPRKLLQSARDGLLVPYLEGVAFVVVDEAHHFPKDDHNDLKVYGAIYTLLNKHFLRNPYKRVLAMTGTFDRMDRKEIMGVSEPHLRFTVQDAVDVGRCPEIYGVQVLMDVAAPEAQAVGDFFDLRLAGQDLDRYHETLAACMWKVYQRVPAPFAAFARTQNEARTLAELFNSLSGLGDRGVKVLLGSTSRAERLAVAEQIRNGSLAGFVTCAVGEEALDIPNIEVIHLIRRCRSYVRNAQAVGRALRVTSSKKRALIVDYQMLLPGLRAKWLGLNLEDISKRSASRVKAERAVNGGPLVCQPNYPLDAWPGLTLSEERAIVLRNYQRMNPSPKEIEALENKKKRYRIFPQRFQELSALLDAWRGEFREALLSDFQEAREELVSDLPPVEVVEFPPPPGISSEEYRAHYRPFVVLVPNKDSERLKTKVREAVALRREPELNLFGEATAPGLRLLAEALAASRDDKHATAIVMLQALLHDRKDFSPDLSASKHFEAVAATLAYFYPSLGQCEPRWHHLSKALPSAAFPSHLRRLLRPQRATDIASFAYIVWRELLSRYSLLMFRVEGSDEEWPRIEARSVWEEGDDALLNAVLEGEDFYKRGKTTLWGDVAGLWLEGRVDSQRFFEEVVRSSSPEWIERNWTFFDEGPHSKSFYGVLRKIRIEGWVSRYGDNPPTEARIVEARLKIGEEKNGDERWMWEVDPCPYCRSYHNHLVAVVSPKDLPPDPRDFLLHVWAPCIGTEKRDNPGYILRASPKQSEPYKTIALERAGIVLPGARSIPKKRFRRAWRDPTKRERLKAAGFTTEFGESRRGTQGSAARESRQKERERLEERVRRYDTPFLL